MKFRLVAGVCASVALLGGCGSDDESSSATSVAASAVETTAASTTVAEASTTTAAPTTTEAAATTTTEAETTIVAETTAATAAPTASSGVGIVAGEDADVDAIVEAYLTVFDSSTPYADKEPFLEDAAALKATVDNYETAGSAVGGIALVPTAVAVTGESATVIYNVEFAGTAVYYDLEGDAIKVGDTWQVPRAKFCDFMAQAQNPCPA